MNNCMALGGPGSASVLASIRKNPDKDTLSDRWEEREAGRRCPAGSLAPLVFNLVGVR